MLGIVGLSVDGGEDASEFVERPRGDGRVLRGVESSSGRAKKRSTEDRRRDGWVQSMVLRVLDHVSEVAQ